MRKSPVLVLLGVTLAACSDAGGPVPVAEDPVADVEQAVGTPIPGQYIVVYKPGARGRSGSVANLVEGGSANVVYEYREAIHGVTLRNVGAAELAALRADPDVEYIEQDQVFTKSATQSGATWGLDRIDQRARPLNGTFVYTATGSGVRAYILDTGIRYDHVDFGGRAVPGFDAIGDGRNGNDCDGHGTHVAGTVGGTTWGVAKAATLVAVRVLDCNGSGTTSGVIAGVDWVRTNHVKPAVANMSLGGGASTALDNAVSNAVAAGVTFVVAAGNSNRDACNFSPARAGTAITVGATTSSDARASYSNFGACLDLFGPGSSITSAWFTTSTATATISGTSMASPHVAGVAAQYLQANPSAAPSSVRNAIVTNATANVVTSAGRRSPNLLLFTNY
ncbi:MAG: S8 family peptidase [Gemmatimonadaceae bacterium]|nr:S8 family peptidase [Gemmatimonadaceae bacterium]